MNEVHLTRQSDLIPTARLDQKIVVIGAGSIGSFVVTQLTKMGFCNITVYDADHVSEYNMCCQNYGLKDIGFKKVHALKERVLNDTAIEIEAIDSHWEDSLLPVGSVVLCCADSMAVREMALKGSALAKLFVDARMGAETAQLHVVRPANRADVERYMLNWYPDDEAIQRPCTAKATMYTACMISGLVAKTVKDFVNDEVLPHTTSWCINTGTFKSFGGQS